MKMARGGYTSDMSGNAKPVLVFLNHWAAQLGGAEYSLIDLLSCAAERAQCHLFTTEHGPLVDKAQQCGVHCHVDVVKHSIKQVKRDHLILTALRSWRGMAAYCSYVFRLRRELRHLRPACVYANVPKSHFALTIIRWSGLRLRSLFHVREIFRQASLSLTLYKLLYPRSLTRTIAISRAVYAALPRCMQKKACVVYNGVAIPKTVRHQTTWSLISFVYLGRIVPWKGCTTLIEAFQYVRQSPDSPDCTLTLIGDTIYWPATYRTALQAMINGGRLQDCCFVRDGTSLVQEELQRHHAFCIASDNEPFGRVVAESMACGLPTIAFDNGAMPELVDNGQTGILVKPGDSIKFGKAMLELAQKPERIRLMGEQARRRAARLYNAANQVPQIYAEIENLGRDTL
ncbi:MAG: glycosyltransferase [Chitinivibrionales bacterium]|nr:glycosyltransferase [Chitinivibrionales bacterium]